MNRLELANKLLPFSAPDAVCLLTEDKTIGWIYKADHIEEALDRWRAGTLNESPPFPTANKKGKPYLIEKPVRLGIVPYCDGMVHYFAPDLDAHEGQAPTIKYDERLSAFFSADPVRFRSKSGKGIRQIYLLETPITVERFHAIIASWGFNRPERIEVFPKSTTADKLSQFWLPNEPNGSGGDTYIGGDWADSVVTIFPDELPARLTNTALDYLLGFKEHPGRHTAQFIACKEMGEKRFPHELARYLCRRAARLCGQDEQKASEKFETDFAAGLKESPNTAISIKNSDDKDIRARLWEVEQTPKISTTERYKLIAATVLIWLHERGRFYHREEQTFASVMFFDSTRKLLLAVQGDAFLSWLADMLGVNRAERTFEFIQSACETEGLTSRATKIEPSNYWESRRGMIYLSCGPGRMARISAAGAELVDNGTDDVLFPYGQTIPSWALTDPIDPFDTSSLYRDMSTNAPHGRELFRLWAIGLPSNQRTKPILCLSGDVGSGKTRAARGIFELYGLPPKINAVEKNGENNFWAAIDGGGMTVFDNADTRTDWLADALAAASTDGSLEKRKLYTDAQRVSLRARSWICVTSANPVFAADAGLADRMLVVRLNRRRGETSEAALTDEILAHRDAGLSWIAHILARALADQQPTPADLNARHPDFAALAVRIGRAIGRGDQAIAALRAAEADKSIFNIENDTVGSALLQIVQAGPFNGTAAELLQQLIAIDGSLSGRISAKSLSKRIKKLWPHLEAVFKAVSEKGHGGILKFTFQKPGGGIGGFEELFS